jgi:UDP-glucose 4-epimerase
MSKVLITGGLGNLGSWLTDYLLQNTDWEIYVLSSKPNYYEFSRPYHLLTVDITDKEALDNVLKPFAFDYVYHLASVNEIFVAGYDELAHRVNVLGTQNLIDVFGSKIPKKWVYLSTFYVYGAPKGVIDEHTICAPLHSYGSTHLLAERIFQSQIPEKNQAIMRLSNSYGCPKLPNNSKWFLVLNDLCKQAVEHKKIKLLSNGKPTRDFIWMGDACEILYQSIRNEEIYGVYNLNSEQVYSMYEIASFVQKAFFEYCGQEIEVEVNTEDQKEYKEDWHLSNQKLINKLPFEFHNQIASEAQKIFKLLEKK